MKVVWTIVALLLLGGLIVLMQPSERGDGSGMSSPTLPMASDVPPPTADATALSTPTSGPANPRESAATPAEPKRETPVVDAAAAGLDAALAARPSATAPEPKLATTPAPAEPKPAPSAERPAPSAEAKAAGTAFTPEIPTIPEAEVSPSSFVRLADGTISVDDAWTISGDGSAETPYEVSWEFLSSAQDSYVPRLGEKKIPARIAFLSGKRVRISGYLAFPLVAPTSSECLVMLNQWDGCCIGIPPTPYDAIEVKLAMELKGWKKHTLNFGAVEGTLKVEPYLVENWLVGLYLLEGAKVNTEL